MESIAEEYKRHSEMVLIKWMCGFILLFIGVLVSGMSYAVLQNHRVEIKLVLLQDIVSDHLKEQQIRNEYIENRILASECDECERKEKKKTYVADSDA